MKKPPKITTIESLSFSVQYGLVNSLTVLLKAWEGDSALQDFISTLQMNPSEQTLALKRIHSLSNIDFEAGTWHPNDMAICAYLYALEQTDSETLEAAIKQILTINGLYWAKKLAQKIASEKFQNLPQKS